jgi:hypothetical protein
MSIFNRLRLDIKGEKIEHEIKQEIVEKEKGNHRGGNEGAGKEDAAGT